MALAAAVNAACGSRHPPGRCGAVSASRRSVAGTARGACQYDRPAEVFAWSGASALLSRAYLESAGLFEERFFLYYEDFDLAWRDKVSFPEYFHGDTGAGLGASQQTGWTALVAKLVSQSGA